MVRKLSRNFDAADLSDGVQIACSKFGVDISVLWLDMPHVTSAKS